MAEIFKLNEFKKDCFPNKKLNDKQRTNLKKKIHTFNISNKTYFFIDFSDFIGETDDKIPLAIRISGKESRLVYVREFKNDYKRIFKEKLEKLLQEFKSYLPNSQTEKIIIKQKNNYIQQLDFGF